MNAAQYKSEIECRARADAEAQFQIAFAALCRTFNLTGTGNRYAFSPETLAEVERIIARLVCLMSDGPIKPNSAAYVTADPAFREFLTKARRKPRKTV